MARGRRRLADVRQRPAGVRERGRRHARDGQPREGRSPLTGRPETAIESLPCPRHEGSHRVVKRAAGLVYLACGCHRTDGGQA
jgi:hypothetical protein